MRENDYTEKDHTFVVCAYGASEYLAECVDSLLAQDVKSNIIISTSTPNEHIKGVADKYGLDLRVNTQPPSISGDWNFAYKQAKTRLITLAHQDDVYLPGYLSTALELINSAKRPIIFFSHYGEIIGDNVQYRALRLNIKNLLLFPVKLFKESKFVRRRVLSLGNPICCPSVIYVDLKTVEFISELKFCLDWDKWEELSKLKGSFIYCNKPLMLHRLHGGAETSKAIQSGTRRNEDYMMFQKFWLTPIAKMLARAYTKSEENGTGL